MTFNESAKSKIIDGRTISDQLLNNLKTMIDSEGMIPKLNIVVDPNNLVSQGYVDLKKRKASEIGLEVLIHTILTGHTTSQVVNLIKELTDSDNEGLIVQLPLPANLNTSEILSVIPTRNDVDVLNRTTQNHIFTQPVAGAVGKALKSVGLDVRALQQLQANSVHVVGNGFLVGSPVSNWLRSIKVEPVIYEKGNDLQGLKTAKIIISGVGKAGLITPDLISEGVVLIDAGTTSDSGELAGDIDPACYDKASFYTPVPGGIGPITLAKLFENCVKINFNEQ